MERFVEIKMGLLADKRVLERIFADVPDYVEIIEELFNNRADSRSLEVRLHLDRESVVGTEYRVTDARVYRELLEEVITCTLNNHVTKEEKRNENVKKNALEIPARVIEDERLSNSEKIVLIAISSRAEGVHKIVRGLSLDKLEKITGLARATISRCTSKIEKLGYIEKMQSGFNNTNLYFVNFEG